MEPITTHDEPSHIWTQEEIIECGLCINENEEEEPDVERDEVNDIISVGAQDEYDADPDVLTEDANDFEDGNNSPIIHEEKEEILEPTIEPIVEPVQEPILEPVQEPIVEPAVVLPFNIEKKEEKEEKEEHEEKGEPVINEVIVNRLALEESAPKNIIVDENNLPFIDLEKEEKQDLKEDPIVQDINVVENVVVEPLPPNDVHVDNISPIVDLEKEAIQEAQVNELIEDRASLLTRDIATFEAPPAKKFKFKEWFLSLWFWT
jgi:hypothetical protein